MAGHKIFCCALLFMLPVIHIKPSELQQQSEWIIIPEKAYPSPYASENAGETSPQHHKQKYTVSFTFYKFEFDASEQSSQLLTDSIRMLTEEGGPSVEVSAPAGRTWIVNTLWQSPDRELVFWRSTGQDGDAIQFATRAFELTDEVPKSLAEIISDHRITFHPAPPESLRQHFSESNSLRPGQQSWRDIARFDHIFDVDHVFAEAIGSMILDKGETPESQRAVKIVEVLLNSKLSPINKHALTGDWRVRSIQGQHGSHFAYPFFKARFGSTQQGEIFFEKLTGSQRRSGLLFPDTPVRWIFLGATTVNDEPQLAYSQIAEPTPDRNNKRESDSIGVLHQISLDHLYMILDVTAGSGYEVYELSKF